MCYFRGKIKQILRIPADQPLQAFKMIRVVGGTFHSPTWGSIWRGSKITGRPTQWEGGIYAFKTKTVVHRFSAGLPYARSRLDDIVAVAELELSGKVFEHAPADRWGSHAGYRGSFARIVRVWMPKGSRSNDLIRKRYPWIEVVEV